MNSTLSNLGLSILFILISLSSFSQKIMRKEISAPPNTDLFRVQNCKEYGCLLFFPTPNFNENNRQYWKFYHIDTNFNESYKHKLAFPPGLNLNTSCQHKNYSTFVFKQKKQNKNNIFILQINNLNNKIDSISFTAEKKSIPKKILATNNQGFIIIKSPDNYDNLIYFDLQNREIKKITLANNFEKTIIQDLIYNPNIDEYACVVQEYQDKRWYANYLAHLNPKKSEINLEFIHDPIDLINFAHEIHLTPSTSSAYYMCGFYDKIRAKSRTISKKKDYKYTGVFFHMIDGENQISRYYDFNSRKNKHKSKKRKKKNRNNNIIGLFNNCSIDSNKLCLITENYYPQFRTITRMEYDNYGRLQPRTEKIFEGYRFTEAQKYCFDLKGQLEYVNRIDLYNILEEKPSSHICHFKSNNEEIMAYMHHSAIASSIFNKETLSFPIDYDQVPTGHKGDKIIEDRALKIQHWQNNSFIIYGYQKIHNKLDNKKDRQVFFISKVIFK